MKNILKQLDAQNSEINLIADGLRKIAICLPTPDDKTILKKAASMLENSKWKKKSDNPIENSMNIVILDDGDVDFVGYLSGWEEPYHTQEDELGTIIAHKPTGLYFA